MSSRAKTWIGGITNLALIAGLALLGAPPGMRAWGAWTQARRTAAFTRSSSVAAHARADHNQYVKPSKTPPARRWETAVLRVPKIGVNALVTEGTGKWELTIGPGHLIGAAGPGGKGNCVIAAHRNMWDAAFADLPKLRPGDRIEVTTSTHDAVYVVDSSREITTRDKTLLMPTNNARITLITCVLPFDRQRRWAVQGHLVVPVEQSAI